jgi:hypothetical protein
MKNLPGATRIGAAEKRKAGHHVRPNFDKTPIGPVLSSSVRTAGDHAPAMTRKLVFWATDLVVKQLTANTRRLE